MKIVINTKDKTATIQGETCTLYEAGLYVNADGEQNNIDRDAIIDALNERYDNPDIEFTPILINIDQLENVLHQAFKDAHKFQWTGWRIPIYVNDDGEVHAGSWLSNNSWQPDLIELIGIERWDVQDIWPECEGDDDDVYWGIQDYCMPWVMEEIERRLKEANQDCDMIDYWWLTGYELS